MISKEKKKMLNMGPTTVTEEGAGEATVKGEAEGGE